MWVERKAGVCRMTVVTDPLFEDFALATLVSERILDSDQTVILDLRFVQMLHSPGLANLAAMYVHLGKRGQALVLTGLNAYNRQLLAMTQLDRLFTIEGETP